MGSLSIVSKLTFSGERNAALLYFPVPKQGKKEILFIFLSESFWDFYFLLRLLELRCPNPTICNFQV